MMRSSAAASAATRPRRTHQRQGRHRRRNHRVHGAGGSKGGRTHRSHRCLCRGGRSLQQLLVVLLMRKPLPRMRHPLRRQHDPRVLRQNPRLRRGDITATGPTFGTAHMLFSGGVASGTGRRRGRGQGGDGSRSGRGWRRLRLHVHLCRGVGPPRDRTALSTCHSNRGNVLGRTTTAGARSVQGRPRVARR